MFQILLNKNDFGTKIFLHLNPQLENMTPIHVHAWVCFSKIWHYYLLETAYLLGVSFCNSIRNAVVSSLHFSDTFQAHTACQTNRYIRVTALHVNRSIL